MAKFPREFPASFDEHGGEGQFLAGKLVQDVKVRIATFSRKHSIGVNKILKIGFGWNSVPALAAQVESDPALGMQGMHFQVFPRYWFSQQEQQNFFPLSPD